MDIGTEGSTAAARDEDQRVECLSSIKSKGARRTKEKGWTQCGASNRRWRGAVGIARKALPWSWLSAMLSALARLIVTSPTSTVGSYPGLGDYLCFVDRALTPKLRFAQAGGYPGPHAGKAGRLKQERAPERAGCRQGNGRLFLRQPYLLRITPRDPSLPDPRPNICVHERQWHGRLHTGPAFTHGVKRGGGGRAGIACESLDLK